MREPTGGVNAKAQRFHELIWRVVARSGIVGRVVAPRGAIWNRGAHGGASGRSLAHGGADWRRWGTFEIVSMAATTTEIPAQLDGAGDPDDEGGERSLGDAGPPTRLVDARTLARRLDVSPTTIRRLVEAREIPYIEVLGRRRFDFAEVLATLKRRTGRK